MIFSQGNIYRGILLHYTHQICVLRETYIGVYFYIIHTRSAYSGKHISGYTFTSYTPDLCTQGNIYRGIHFHYTHQICVLRETYIGLYLSIIQYTPDLRTQGNIYWGILFHHSHQICVLRETYIGVYFYIIHTRSAYSGKHI